MDRIVINNRKDMERVIGWSLDYIDYNGDDDFNHPFEKGELILGYEGYGIYFEVLSEKIVRFDVYADTYVVKYSEGYDETVPVDVILGKQNKLPSAYDIKLCKTNSVNDRYQMLGSFKFDYALGGDGVYDVVFSKKIVRDNKLFMPIFEETIRKDNTWRKVAMKYLFVMIFTQTYSEELSRSSTVHTTKKPQQKKPGKKKQQPKLLHTRTYVINAETTQQISKRKVTGRRKPDHEFGVRGHWRHYASGKTVWIKPQTRCKGRKPSKLNVYVTNFKKEVAI